MVDQHGNLWLGDDMMSEKEQVTLSNSSNGRQKRSLPRVKSRDMKKKSCLVGPCIGSVLLLTTIDKTSRISHDVSRGKKKVVDSSMTLDQ